MMTFKEWLKEMCGTGVVYDGSTGPDFQVWGAPWSATDGRYDKKMKIRKKKSNDESKRSSP